MNTDNTPLGDRMKVYEHTYRQYMPRRTYTLMRLDGRAFHSYLKGAAKPFDHPFMGDMDLVARRLCEEIQGARFAYTQSDEISLLAYDFETTQTQPWFGGNRDKLVSVSASIASAYLAVLRHSHPGLPQFDSRVWTVSDPVEVANYFVWRQRDAVRNSVQMVAQTRYSPAHLMHKSTDQLREMLFTEHGIDWNNYPVGAKQGRLVFPNEEHGWVTCGAPLFKAEPDTVLAALIPRIPSLWDKEEA